MSPSFPSTHTPSPAKCVTQLCIYFHEYRILPPIGLKIGSHRPWYPPLPRGTPLAITSVPPKSLPPRIPPTFPCQTVDPEDSLLLSSPLFQVIPRLSPLPRNPCYWVFYREPLLSVSLYNPPASRSPRFKRLRKRERFLNFCFLFTFSRTVPSFF